MNPTSGKSITAIAIAIALFVGTGASQISFAGATTIEAQSLDTKPPVNTEQSLLDTHASIVASIQSTSNVPDEFNVRWTQPGVVKGYNGVSLFVVDCLPGEYPGNERFMGAEGVDIIQQFVIGSGSDYLSMLYLVANFGDEDQVIKLGVTCIDEDGNESGDNDADESGDVTRITNNNNIIVNNIVNNIVKNINKNITIINNSTNNTVVTPAPTGNTTTTPGGNTTTTTPGGNTTTPDTGGGGTGDNATATETETTGAPNANTTAGAETARSASIIPNTSTEEETAVSNPNECERNPDGTGCAIPPSGTPGSSTSTEEPSNEETSTSSTEEEESTATEETSSSNEETTEEESSPEPSTSSSSQEGDGSNSEGSEGVD